MLESPLTKFICSNNQGKEENLMGTKPALKNGHGDELSENQQSPCVTHFKKWSQIGECLLCEALGEDVSSFLCRWEILQRYHQLMHQAPDVMHVSLNVLCPLSFFCINVNIYWNLIVTPNYSGWIKCKTKFSKNALQPHTLCRCSHCSSMLSLS